MICKICNNSENNKEFKIREMMFGFRDEFTYFECSKCGCLQIMQIPRNMEKYYPSNYYSFEKLDKTNNFIRKILRRKRDMHAFFKKDFIWKLLHKKYPNILLEVVGRLKINYNSKILDAGCGAGNFLYSLNKIGFKNLVGVDPYINKDIIDVNIKILKKTILELPNNKKYDLIISNHSFEHISNQLETLVKISKILSENDICLLRMPIKTEYIWDQYGINWVQIDVTRHFLLHTIKSFKLLIGKVGLVIRDIIFDSTEFQFWGSEQYIKNIPLKIQGTVLCIRTTGYMH